MSDSKDSTVTYTEVSSLFKDLLDIGSLGIDGLPMMPHDLYAYMETALLAPPSPDYVPGPVELEQPPPTPEFVLEPAYSKFMPLENDLLPTEEQPLPAAEEEEEESSGDDANIEDKDEEEEEHPALADFVPPPLHRVTAKIAVMIKLRAESPSTSHPLPLSIPPSRTPPLLPTPLHISPPPLHLASMSHRADILHVTLPPRKRLCNALGLRFEVGKSSSALTARPTGGFRVDYGFVGTLDDEIRRDPEREKMAPKRATLSTPATTTTTTTTPVTNAQLKALIGQGIADALAARDADRSQNSKDNHDSGTGLRRQSPPARECTYQDFMKCKPLYFKGTEGVVELTQWFERMETMFHISNFTVENQIKFATCTLLGSALTWWNSYVKTVGSGQKHTCFECEAQRHFKKECLKLKNNNHGNQGRNNNAPAKVYAIGHAGINPDSNVITGTFLLNNHYASILFDTGFYIKILKSSLQYRLNARKIGSFDVIIGMDWLAKYQGVIVCAEKIVCIHLGDETLIIRGDGSDRGNDTHLNIISCTRTHNMGTLSIGHFRNERTVRLTEGAVKIKSLLDTIGIIAAHVCVNAAQLELVLLVDFNEKFAKCLLILYKDCLKLMLLKSYYCSRKYSKCLDEFATKHVAENTKSSKEETKTVRKNDDAPIIKEWVSDDEEENVSQPKLEKKTVRPGIVKKEFVKPK
nr:hypothetical protein [Tanacetum cinerariifolium]